MDLCPWEIFYQYVKLLVSVVFVIESIHTKWINDGLYLSLNIFLNISTTLLDTYSQELNKFCRRNGNNQEFSEIGIAKETCSKDGGCVGFYDRFGAGSTFRLCNQPLDIIPDIVSGHILYPANGMCKLTSSYTISHDCKI